jgi:pimeloyl-ACP methyl ester carboxylesterase
MRIFWSLTLVLACCATNLMAQPVTSSREQDIKLETSSGTIYGTLSMPEGKKQAPVVLIIPGSGPTDRNGNQMMMVQAQPYRLLADSLLHYGIATVRIDKRGIAASKEAAPSEENLRFNNYIEDVQQWIELLRRDKRFNKVVVLGHSEGSLIGMAAANKVKPDGFISVAGAAEPADVLLRQQLSSQLPPHIMDSVEKILVSLKAGKQVPDTDPNLAMLFRKSVQPYIISWFQYDPRQELDRLSMPVLIAQGTHDIQVDTAQARMLLAAKPDARYLQIEGMSHVLKPAPADKLDNVATYSEPGRPIPTELVQGVRSFVTGLKKGK